MMKKGTLFLKKISGRSLEKALVIAFAWGLATISNGQTQLISASDGGFENATSTFAANGWSTAQPGITRQWQVGTAGGSVTGGTKSAYVGTTTTYNGSTTSGTFHFYRDLVIPAGSTNVLLNYELKYPTLDAGFDYFYVFTTTTANTPVSGTLPGAGYTQIFENDATTYAAFTAMPQVDLTSLAGTTVRLVFTFVTDGITPNAKPAVDNVTLSYTTPTPCSGTPTPGNTVSTASAVCTGTNFTLSMQNNYSGLTYQWQSSPTNSGFTNIAGDTNATLTTSQTAATYYQCVVTCTSSTLSSNSTPLQVGITTLCNYCTPINSTGCTDGDEITNVTFAGINNTTGCSGTGGYNDFTSITGNVNAGQSYPVSITTGTGGGLTNEGVAVWIDFNQNGTFEPTEMVYSGYSGNDPATYTGTIAIPGTALAGTTRMRVRCDFDQAPLDTDPCTVFVFGETEDYDINITPLTPCSGTPAPGATASTATAICNNVNFTLSLPAIVNSGFTYQWQSSPVNSGFTNITGATSASLTTSQTAATYYQCVVTCTSSSSSATSTPIQVTVTTLCNYCVADNTFGCTDGDEITNVTFAGINNTTGCAGDAGGYNDYTTISGNVVTGSAYPITISTGTGGGLTNEGVAVWIDYNQNGIFETTEYVYNSYSGADPATYNGSITIPLTALTGTTRMRVRCEFNSAPINTDVCDDLSFGETEDYTINITSTSATIDMGSSSVSAPTVHCYTSTETVSATVENFSTSAINLATNPVTVNCTVTGANPNNTTFTPIVLNTGTIAAGGTQVVTFSTTYNMSGAGTYVITSYTSISGDASALNDTTRTTYTRAANPTVIGNASVNPICSGLSDTLTGGGAVSYAWSGGVTDGTAFNATTTTTYTVTGTDANGCTNTSTATVTVNQLPAVTGAASLNPICAGLNDTLRGSGATSYVWSGGITDGTAFAVNGTATYTVTGTDGNGCVNTSTATITITPATTTPVAIIGSDSICGGSSGNYYVAAVSSATSYTWTLPSGWVGTSITDSISVSSVTTSGTISVTADNTCGSSTAQTLNVTAGAVLAQPSSILGVTHLCDSSSTAYAVTTDPNATSYTWTLPSGWSGTSTTSTITATASTTSGVISVTANSGCGSSTPSTLNVVGNTIPTVTVSSFGTVCDNVAAFTLSGGNPTGGNYSGTGVNSNIFDPATSGDGTFMLTYTYASGACIRSDSAAIVVDLCTGINSYSTNGNVNIYPNPTNGMFTIHIGNADFNEMIITVVDIQGREVYKSLDKNINSDYNKQISLEGVAKGIYYIKLNYGAEVNVEKLIIE